MIVELKIKIKSLAAEARIIRHHESKALRSARVARVRQRLQEAGLDNSRIERIARRAEKQLGKRVLVENPNVPHEHGKNPQLVYADTKALRQASVNGPYDLLGSFMTQYQSLRAHRTQDVRSEARSSLLAYACLRGRSYKSVESNARVAPDWDRIANMATRFNANERSVTQSHVEGWVDGAKAAFKLMSKAA